MADELSDLHISELHARAAERGIEGYRLLRREQLVEALSDGSEERPARRRRSRGGRGRGGRGRERERSGGERARRPTRRGAPKDDDAGEVEVEGTVVGDDEPEEDLPTEEVTGVLELTRQRFGFLRMAGLAPADGDVYISASQVRRCELRPGDEVSGPARQPRRGERHRALVRVDAVNGAPPEAEEARPTFDDLSPVLPERRIPLDAAREEVLLRAVDLLAPLALGQRVLVRAAPRSGRTTLLRGLARAAVALDDARVVVLLIDERPEEATAWRESVSTAEFAIATADMSPVEQLRIAELALERSRRLAEGGQDVVLVCDSLSRLAIAAGEAAEVKRLFGSGRNLAGGGSLTVVATVLDGTADEGEAERAVITTESSLVVLDAGLAEAGIHPAIDPAGCRVSNEDQIRTAEELEAARKLRSLLADLDPAEAARLLRERIEGSATNAELLASI